MPVELSVLLIENVSAWRQWLVREADLSKGVWLTLAKKGTTEPTSLTYAQALDEALCHGWIDGQTRKIDEATYSHRFTPRATKSIWSKRNVSHIARLESEGRIQARGRSEVERAKADGRWDAAYAGPATIETPTELSTAIAANPEAQAMWDILTKQNRYALCFRLHAVKTHAGRRKRIDTFVDMLAKGETYHPQKQTRAPVAAGRVSKIKPAVSSSSRAESTRRRSERT